MKVSGYSLKRVAAMVRHEIFVTRRSLEIFFDIFFFPLINIALFGLISRYVTGGHTINQYLILGVLLWEIVTIMQYNVTVSTMWEVWSHNLTNIFITPISIVEYMSGHILSGIIKTATVLVLLTGTADLLFSFNLLHVGILNLVLFSLNLSLFAVWIGLLLLGFIFRYGSRMSAISWGVIFLFQPLTAAFFPLYVLPHWVQYIAKVLPATYVFEDARRALSHPDGILWHAFAATMLLNIIYTLLCLAAFKRLFEKSKDSGQFARNDIG